MTQDTHDVMRQTETFVRSMFEDMPQPPYKPGLIKDEKNSAVLTPAAIKAPPDRGEDNSLYIKWI